MVNVDIKDKVNEYNIMLNGLQIIINVLLPVFVWA